MSEHKKPDQSRRQLLKNIGLTVAAGAVAAGTTTAVQAGVDKPEEKNENSTGYRETKHIRDYYETL
ncbi:twin-arginine translocation signal domain-containing protein [Photobacterium makurazakiensis]|uniref:twin-arginine translocation signal domain-containing protein n=1 Tax=Photobacterium makurazakiensis TaxID=2910234 RepID=UPI003D0EBB6F